MEALQSGAGVCPGFTVYWEDLEEYAECLTERQIGMALRALCAFRNGEELPALDRAAKLMFVHLRNKIREQEAKYCSTVEKNRGNARKRYQKPEETPPSREESRVTAASTASRADVSQEKSGEAAASSVSYAGTSRETGKETTASSVSRADTRAAEDRDNRSQPRNLAAGNPQRSEPEASEGGFQASESKSSSARDEVESTPEDVIAENAGNRTGTSAPPQTAPYKKPASGGLWRIGDLVAPVLEDMLREGASRSNVYAGGGTSRI